MRNAMISVLCAFLLLFCFSHAANAQSGATSAQLPEALARRLSLSTELPELQRNAQAGKSPSEFAEFRLNDKALAQLKEETESLASNECGHILIFVAPVTDPKMIIQVPDSAPNGRTTPKMKACGEDLRMVNAARSVVPATPLIPRQSVVLPH